MYNACNATNDRGERIIEPGTVIVSDCASVHSGVVQTILKPYLQDLQVQQVFLPKIFAGHELLLVVHRPN